MAEALAAFLALLATILPPIIAHYTRISAGKRLDADEMVQRSLDELDAVNDRVREQTRTQPPV